MKAPGDKRPCSRISSFSPSNYDNTLSITQRGACTIDAPASLESRAFYAMGCCSVVSKAENILVLVVASWGVGENL